MTAEYFLDGPCGRCPVIDYERPACVRSRNRPGHAGLGDLHARERNVPKKAANGSSEQNPKDAAARSDQPVARRRKDPAVEKTPVEDGAAKKRPRRKAVAKKAASGKRANPGDTASSARAVATGPSLPLGPVALDTPAERISAMQTAAECLGISELYPEQVEVIDAVITGQDVLMVLPTGFGKSACYQIPSLILNKPVLVISPLLALMRDQYEKLLKLGVPCIRLDGTIRGKKRTEALKRIRTGEPVLVMTTPETLGASDASEALAHSGLSMAAVDEAHCISEWGYDFRPAYLQIGERLRTLGGAPVLALTATATEKVRSAIQRFVRMDDPRIVASSPHRSNLAFDVLLCSG